MSEEDSSEGSDEDDYEEEANDDTSLKKYMNLTKGGHNIQEQFTSNCASAGVNNNCRSNKHESSIIDRIKNRKPVFHI